MRRRRILWLVAGAGLPCLPARAQMMPGMAMPGMSMPMPHDHAAKPRPKPKSTPAPLAKHTTGPADAASHAAPSRQEPAPPMTHDMAGMAMPMSDMPPARPADSAGAGTGAEERAALAGTALPAGDAPPPPLPADHYADRDYPAAAMAQARARMMREEGGRTFAQALLNLAEYQARRGGGYRWDGEAWLGGDIDRVVIRTEGSGSARAGVEDAEAQALYSHAIGPYFNLQGGVRQDFRPRPGRTYASIGVEGLIPTSVEAEARLFVSMRGEVLGRIEAWYDLRLTQRAVLQPRVELNLSAQDMRARGIGAGLADAELGLRLRYEISRRFAPYVGMSTIARTGRSAGYARANGEGATTTAFVAGIRGWF